MVALVVALWPAAAVGLGWLVAPGLGPWVEPLAAVSAYLFPLVAIADTFVHTDPPGGLPLRGSVTRVVLTVIELAAVGTLVIGGYFASMAYLDVAITLGPRVVVVLGIYWLLGAAWQAFGVRELGPGWSLRPLEDERLEASASRVAATLDVELAGVWVMRRGPPEGAEGGGDEDAGDDPPTALAVGLLDRAVLLSEDLVATRPRPEVLAVIAHELAHHRLNHVRLSLLTVSAWLLVNRCAAGAGNMAGVVVGAAACAVVAAWASRRQEYAADDAAWRATGDPAAYISALAQTCADESRYWSRVPDWAVMIVRLTASHPRCAERVQRVRRQTGGQAWATDTDGLPPTPLAGYAALAGVCVALAAPLAAWACGRMSAQTLNGICTAEAIAYFLVARALFGRVESQAQEDGEPVAPQPIDRSEDWKIGVFLAAVPLLIGFGIASAVFPPVGLPLVAAWVYGFGCAWVQGRLRPLPTDLRRVRLQKAAAFALVALLLAGACGAIGQFIWPGVPVAAAGLWLVWRTHWPLPPD